MNNLKAVVIALSLTCVRGHPAYWNSPNQLHPVQGLYVKPSVDGTTGDLYVAATEDNGVKTQWLTDQPINFLPTQTAGLPLSYASSFSAASLPHDETLVSTQKRAVVTSPAFKYTYSMPGSSDGSSISYPYSALAPANSLVPATEGTETAEPVAASYPQYPYQYYYPQMMTAFANAMSVLKDAGVSDDTAGSLMSQPMWPSYTYPVQYVMVDPATWAASQAAQATPATTTIAPESVPTESKETA